MALDFADGSTNEVQITTDSSFENQTAITYIIWVSYDQFQANKRLLYKDGEKEAAHFASGPGVDDWHWEVGRATTAAIARANENLSTGTVYFVAFTYDESDGPRIFYATLNGEVTEVSYHSRQVGSGATNNDSGGDLYYGGALGAAVACDAQISRFCQYNSRLTIGEIKAIRYNPIRSDLVIYHECGFSGTTTQADWSGSGNSGSISGATQTAHASIPLPPTFQPKIWLPYIVAIVAGQPTMIRTQGVPTGPGRRDRPGRWN